MRTSSSWWADDRASTKGRAAQPSAIRSTTHGDTTTNHGDTTTTRGDMATTDGDTTHHRDRSVTDHHDDRRLARDFLRTRSEAAFRALYRLHTPPLYGFALRLARGNEDEAQDIVQEAWVRAVARLDGFRWQSSLKTWLHAVALNVHRELVRRRHTVERYHNEAQRRFTVVRGGERPPALDLERAIDELPDGQREVLILHDVEGYTHEEIATLTGIAAGTSKSQLSRARQGMRAWLQKRTPEAIQEGNDHG